MNFFKKIFRFFNRLKKAPYQLDDTIVKLDQLYNKITHIENHCKKIESLNKLEQRLINLEVYNQNPKILLSNNDLFIVSANEFFFAFPKDQLNHGLSYLNSNFDRGLRQWINKHCTPNSTFVDIGSNVGIFSGIASKLVGPNGKVIAIEPLKILEKTVRQNVLLNGPLTPFEFLPYAVGKSEGVMEFEVFKQDNRVSTLFSYGDNQSACDIEKIEVSVKPLANILKLNTHKVIIKIDAEGAEGFLLNQLHDLFKKYPSVQFIVAMEYGPIHLKRAQIDPKSFIDQIKTYWNSTPLFIDPLTGDDGDPLNDLNLGVAGNIYFEVNPSLN